MKLRPAPDSVLSEVLRTGTPRIKSLTGKPLAFLIRWCTISTTNRLRHSGNTKGLACWIWPERAKDCVFDFQQWILFTRASDDMVIIKV